jgi:hypothetical protein
MWALLTILAIPKDDIAADRTALLQNVTELKAPGALPGPMVATGGNSFVVLTSGNAPLFVAAKSGRGRILAGGHESFVSSGNLKFEGNAQFFRNALGWLGQKPLTGLTVGEFGLGGIREWITANGAKVANLSRTNLYEQLRQVDVLCLNQAALDGDAAAQEAVTKFIRTGHGLVIVGPAWGWQQTQPGKDLRRDHSGNQIILPFGIGFADGTVDGKYSPAGAESPLLTTTSAMEALRGGQLTSGDVTTATATVQRALSIMPNAAHGLREEIQKLAKSEGSPDGPSRKTPITTKMPFSRLLATIEGREWDQLPANKVRAYRSAADFPGAIPASTPRVTRTVTIDTAVPEWHGIGLYAAPGEAVSITIPEAAKTAGIGVRIGSHTDELWHLTKWERFPAVSRRWELKGIQTSVASPFGGTIFIDVPSRCKVGKIDVKVARAVPALRFVLGETTTAQWNADLATVTAPWVELEGKTVALSVPRSAVLNLTDPAALMTYWDEVFAACRRLYAAPARPRKERYCVDRQISAGYMHSGYPIMTGDDVANTFCDLSKLRAQGFTWGFYHELGHNFQQSDWTFDGTGEVTNNLFSIYGSEVLNGITPADYGKAHPAIEYSVRQKRLAEYLAQGAPFARWKSDPFLALTMYIQIREAFGWDPFKFVFAEYERATRRPETEVDQHDLWMTRMSRATKHNLAPFFKAWGVPVSDSAVDGLKDLPNWMPADWPKT